MASTGGDVDATRSDTESNVGVLGWLGFIIINCAAFGIIAVSSVIAWPIGFAISLAYMIATIALAIFLRRKNGEKYRQFVNLLWVLGCSFLFILGLYISINVIPGEPGEDSSASRRLIPDSLGAVGSGSLLGQLPIGSSVALRAWAEESDWALQRAPNFAVFAGDVFFNGKQGGGGHKSRLFRASPNESELIVPALTEPYSFAEFQSRLYFFASAHGNVRGLWVINSGSSSTAELVKDFGSMRADRLRHLFVDTASSSLYFKAQRTCSFSDEVFRSDGTANGTVSLSKQDCAMPPTNPATSDRPSNAQLWSLIFLACLPMLVLASTVLVYLQMPGLFLNLFGGVLVAVVMMYLLAVDRDTSNMDTFLKVFITIYTAAQKVGIFVVSVLRPKLKKWLDELKTWAVVIVTGTFFVIIHIDLEIPFTPGHWWRWMIYALLSLELMVFSIVVSRTVPMVLGAVGAFVVAWKISFEIVDKIFQFTSSEVQTLIMLGILGSQGVGIILAAIYYANRQKDIDSGVRGMFSRHAREPPVGMVNGKQTGDTQEGP